jgi:uncharacterized LabA/DUF88 family protein
VSTAPLRVWVFIDSQNVYRDAREAFHDHKKDPGSYGQIYPRNIAEMVTQRGSPKNPRPRQLDEVRLYTGFPSSSRDPKGYGAHMKHRSFWEKSGVKVVPRPLRYPDNWPQEKPYEKGIDVSLAVDLVFAASRRYFDVAIVLSTDTDLLPAIEAVCELRRAWGEPQIEVGAWADHPKKKRLRADPYTFYCHWLSAADYAAVRDHTNYTL